MRAVKNVSFSLDDPHEMKLWKHAEDQKVFSRYVKRLIERDMRGVVTTVDALTNSNPIEDGYDEVMGLI